MRRSRLALAAGLVGLAVAGTAMAATAEMHTMNVELPNGGVAHISYVGDTAPQVSVAPISMQEAALADDEMFAPFAEMERISAMMERQHQMMMQRVALMQQAAQQNMQNALASGQAQQGMVMTGSLPAGSSVHYSFTSYSSGNGGCTQSVQWSSDGSDKQPQVIRTSSGACDAAPAAGQSSVIATSAKPEQKSEPAGKKV